ncbi:unnamed protein product [Rhizophagus irregularis]|nr:unnamed protein product [Rhizophagus irregularis]
MDIILKVTVFPILMKICYTPLCVVTGAHFLAFGTTSVQSSFPKLITRNDGSLRLYRNFISNLSATEFQFPTLATNTFEDRFM